MVNRHTPSITSIGTLVPGSGTGGISSKRPARAGQHRLPAAREPGWTCQRRRRGHRHRPRSAEARRLARRDRRAVGALEARALHAGAGPGGLHDDGELQHRARPLPALERQLPGGQAVPLLHATRLGPEAGKAAGPARPAARRGLGLHLSAGGARPGRGPCRASPRRGRSRSARGAPARGCGHRDRAGRAVGDPPARPGRPPGSPAAAALQPGADLHGLRQGQRPRARSPRGDGRRARGHAA
ncbi:hypothetical protein OSTOST_11089 [Ostertagia ostertagi]